MKEKNIKHTPGPWHVGVDNDDTFVCIREGDPVCEMHDMEEQTEANASLISKAPEMLQVLKAIRVGAIAEAHELSNKILAELGI